MSDHPSAATAVVETQSPHRPAIHLQHTDSGSSTGSSAPGEPPPPPVPSSDPRLSIVPDAGHPAGAPAEEKEEDEKEEEHDLFKLPAVEALRLLSASVELLVRMTGDVPPTPPPKTPSDPQMSGLQAEKESIARSHSARSMALLRQQAELEEERRRRAKERSEQQQQQQQEQEQRQGGGGTGEESQGVSKLQAYRAALSAKLMAQQDLSVAQAVDGVRLRHAHSATPPTSPPADDAQGRPDDDAFKDQDPYLVVGADSQPLNQQHGAITRKFYSKNEPPITVAAYLLRLHQFCPMSTAVYLATSLYIHRLAVEERAIPVTRRNAHRLVLAGLRVAMKALEDLSYPHSKVAKVGGVSEAELARLEISFCFLAGFELMVREEGLQRHWETLRGGKAQQILNAMAEAPALRLGRRPRNVVPEG